MDRNLFKAALAAKGMTQKELAEKLGISGNTLRLKLNKGGDFKRDEIACLYQLFSKEVGDGFLYA